MNKLNELMNIESITEKYNEWMEGRTITNEQMALIWYKAKLYDDFIKRRTQGSINGWKKLTPEQRSERAKRASQARWSKASKSN